MPRTIPEGSRYHPDGPDEIDTIREGRAVPVGFRCSGCGEYRAPSPGTACRECRVYLERRPVDDGWGEARDYVEGFDE